MKHQQSRVPVPRISSLAELDLDEIEEGKSHPWMEAVHPSLITGGSGERRTPWWAEDEDSPLADELCDYVTDYPYEDEDEDEDEDDADEDDAVTGEEGSHGD
ncbi:hypothetical protein AB0C96_03490 [Streptomyces sp. NPDC048506]|uniref:hypothetical protein n=1 Tax=Streptomyces sp. NPDC048506 TaxID=3155028 RepID=UPI003449C1DC